MYLWHFLTNLKANQMFLLSERERKIPFIFEYEQKFRFFLLTFLGEGWIELKEGKPKSSSCIHPLFGEQILTVF